MTKLLQLNARHSAAVWSLLEKSVKEQGVDIVAVQDPPMEAKLPIGKWEGFHFLFGRGSSPQMAIAIKKSIGFISLDLGCKRVCGLVIQVSGLRAQFCRPISNILLERAILSSPNLLGLLMHEHKALFCAPTAMDTPLCGGRGAFRSMQLANLSRIFYYRRI